MQIDHLHECAHAACICQITTEQDYCGDSCRDNAAAGKDSCTCGHLDCALEPAKVEPLLAQPA